MPYIAQQRRLPSQAPTVPMQGPGELNYRLTRIITQYLDDEGLTYTTLNDIIGALECAKCEFYRRVVIPYETQKMAENGDVYE